MRNYVNVASKSKKQKKLLVAILKVTDENSRIRSRIQIRIVSQRYRSTEQSCLCDLRKERHFQSNALTTRLDLTQCDLIYSLFSSSFYSRNLSPRSSVADPDPGSGIGCFLTAGSGIRNRFFLDPGSRISDPGSQDHIFKSFLTIFLVKSSIIL